MISKKIRTTPVKYFFVDKKNFFLFFINSGIKKIRIIRKPDKCEPNKYKKVVPIILLAKIKAKDSQGKPYHKLAINNSRIMNNRGIKKIR